MYYVALGCDVYRVTMNGQHWARFKHFKTERGAKNWVARHSR